MDKVKINAAVDALGISLDHRNVIKEALNEGAGDGMQELETKVDDIDKEVGTVSTDIATVKEDIATVKGNVSTLTEKVGTNSKTIANNTALFKQVDGKVATVTKDVDSLKETVAKLPTKEYVLTKATKEAIGGVKAITNIADIDTEKATVASLAGVINTLLAQMRTAGIIQL